MKIHYYSWIRENLKKSEDVFDLEKSSLPDLLSLLIGMGQSYKDIFSNPGKICISVNNILIHPNEIAHSILSQNDEVAFFPPISGG